MSFLNYNLAHAPRAFLLSSVKIYYPVWGTQTHGETERALWPSKPPVLHTKGTLSKKSVSPKNQKRVACF